jgi:PTH2 family peptidyl-tRNA hydrolase
MYKQVIVLRKDLNMRKGKMIAQGAHASHMALGFTFPIGWKLFKNLRVKLRWLRDGHKKIAVSCRDSVELLNIYEAAVKAGLPVSFVIDNGHTEFKGVKTSTCLCIGPALSTEIDKITEDLPLL